MPRIGDIEFELSNSDRPRLMQVHCESNTTLLSDRDFLWRWTCPDTAANRNNALRQGT